MNFERRFQHPELDLWVKDSQKSTMSINSNSFGVQFSKSGLPNGMIINNDFVPIFFISTKLNILLAKSCEFFKGLNTQYTICNTFLYLYLQCLGWKYYRSLNSYNPFGNPFTGQLYLVAEVPFRNWPHFAKGMNAITHANNYKLDWNIWLIDPLGRPTVIAIFTCVFRPSGLLL